MTGHRLHRITRVEAKRPAGTSHEPQVIVTPIAAADPHFLDEVADAVQELLDRVRRERGG